MEAILRELSREDIIRFYMEFRLAEQAIDDRLEEYDEQEPLPSYLDADAVGWIVSQGRAFCEAIYRDPAKFERSSHRTLTTPVSSGGLRSAFMRSGSERISLLTSMSGGNFPGVSP